MKLAAIIAIAIVLTGGGVAGYYVYTGHVTGTTDTTDTTPTDSTQIEPTTYTGAEVLNYNSNAAQNPSAYDGIDAIYKGKSGTVMVFQIAEIKNCVYALIDHTGGDGNVKQLSFSESTSIGQSFTETTEKAVAYTTGSEKSHGTDYSNSIALGAEVGGGNIFVSVKGSITYTWQTGV